MADTLEMAEAFAISLGAVDTAVDASHAPADRGMEAVLARWLALTEVVNGINRCMGVPDLYPFMISPAVGEKLDCIATLASQRSV
jgi:hypothetical protein